MTAQPAIPADLAPIHDAALPHDAAWDEFKTMTADDCSAALAYLAGRDPDMFARVLELTRPHRLDGEARP